MLCQKWEVYLYEPHDFQQAQDPAPESGQSLAAIQAVEWKDWE